jgi:hypothetical protein
VGGWAEHDYFKLSTVKCVDDTAQELADRVLAKVAGDESYPQLSAVEEDCNAV